MLKTYTFRAKSFATKEVITASIDAKNKTQAQNAALMDTRFKGWEIVMSSFCVEETFKNGNLLDGKSPSEWINSYKN
jgi:hypothetical protein